MRIAIWHNLPSGGGKRALYQHIKGLLAREHEVVAWCPASADQSYLPLSQIITEHIRPSRPIYWQAPPSKAPFAWLYAQYQNTLNKITSMDEHCRMCADEINTGGFDVFFSASCMYMGVPSIGRYINIPKALYLQEPNRFLYEAMPHLPWEAFSLPNTRRRSWTYIKGFLANIMMVQGLRRQVREEVLNASAFNKILVNSYFSRESVLRAYGCESQVCYLGIDTQLFVHKYLERDTFVVGLGSITPAKNIRFVIEALSHIDAQQRPKLVWIGNMAFDYHVAELKRYADSVNVVFEPKVGLPDDALVSLLNQAALMAYAPRLEPFGLAPLEGNACGLPVVAVAEGGVRETIITGVNGVLVDANPRAMAEAILKLLNDPVYARQLGEGGAEVVKERWSVDKAITRVEEQLLDLN